MVGWWSKGLEVWESKDSQINAVEKSPFFDLPSHLSVALELQTQGKELAARATEISKLTHDATIRKSLAQETAGEP